MGNDLYVMVNGERVANIGRKYSYTFYGGNNDLPTEEEIDKHLADTRQHIVSTITGYAMWLATQEEKPLTEHVDDIVSSVNDLIEVFEHEVQIAGRNFTLGQMTDEFNEENVEVIDDGELERRRQLEEKYDKAKKEMYADLHKKIEKVNWDAVEDQTGEVDLDFEKDTLVGKKWEENDLSAVDIVNLAQKDAKTENEGLEDWKERECEDVKSHRQSIEEIGYCSECRKLEEEEEKYLERQNYN